MKQPAGEPGFPITFSDELFGYKGTIYVYDEDINELNKDDMLNVSILQIFCM
jgi:hypothetical protein